MTTATTFKQNTELLKGHLVAWVTETVDTQGIHAPLFPNPCCALKENNLKRNPMEMTPISLPCSTKYSYTEYSINEVPPNKWTIHPSMVSPLVDPRHNEATTSTRVSPLSRDEFDCMENENARLSKEITE